MKYTSIITNDLTRCYVCGRPYPQIHHMMNGANKKKSEKYGLILPLCMLHHTGGAGPHTKPEIMLGYKQMAQKYFEKDHTREEWIAEFGKSYL